MKSCHVSQYHCKIVKTIHGKLSPDNNVCLWCRQKMYFSYIIFSAVLRLREELSWTTGHLLNPEQAIQIAILVCDVSKICWHFSFDCWYDSKKSCHLSYYHWTVTKSRVDKNLYLITILAFDIFGILIESLSCVQNLLTYITLFVVLWLKKSCHLSSYHWTVTKSRDDINLKLITIPVESLSCVLPMNSNKCCHAS